MGGGIPTPEDFSAEDSSREETEAGLDQCAVCETLLSVHGHVGPVFDSSGIEFESIYQTDPSNGPFFCPDCWEELCTNVKRRQNSSLFDFEAFEDRPNRSIFEYADEF